MHEPEGKALAGEWLLELEGWDWDQLVPLAEKSLEKQIEGPSGNRYRLLAYTFWDTYPWGSDLYIKVRVYPATGWRRWRGYRMTSVKPGEELPPDRSNRFEAT